MHPNKSFRSFTLDETFNGLLGLLSQWHQLLRTRLEEFVVLLLEVLLRSASNQIPVDSLSSRNYVQHRMNCIAEVQSVHRTMSDIKVCAILRECCGRAFQVVSKMDCRHDGEESCHLNSHRDCNSTGSYRRIRGLFLLQQIGGGLPLQGALLPLRPQLFVRFGFLSGGLFARYLLAPHCKCKGPHSQSCLGPCRPFALRHAERAGEPAAVVNRIGHATFPVFSRAIVCGGKA